MRIMVAVPQDVAPSVQVGVFADVSVREFAGQKFHGTVARSARSLDEATRTMETEVRLPNPDGKLMGGMYAQVSITLPSPHKAFEIPATALYTDAKGQRVAVVDADGHVHFMNVVVERDTGATVIISIGLAGNERIIKITSASLSEGEAVEASP
jgi:membrane fusion protein (multidrug efflux system)